MLEFKKIQALTIVAVLGILGNAMALYRPAELVTEPA